MLFNTLLSLSLFLATIGVGAALRCYACAGTGLSDCAKGKKASMSIQSCANMSDPSVRKFLNNSDTEDNESEDSARHQAVCFQLFETDYKPKLFARGCVIVPVSTDPCDYVSKYVPVQGCKSCRTNLCNKRHQRSEHNPLENNTVV